MNSDNPVREYSVNKGLLRSNGLGSNYVLGALYQYTPYIGLLGSIEYNNMKGEQDEGENRADESVTFNSKSFAFTGSLVVNLASTGTLSKFYGRSNRRAILPYVKVGAGIIRYSAESFSNGVKNTSEKSYPSSAAALVIGGGVKYRLSKVLSVGPEFNVNLTNTDFLDNTAGNGGHTGKNDKVASLRINLIYTPISKKMRFQDLSNTRN